MKNYQLYMLKIESDKLKDFNYNIPFSFDEAKSNNEIIAVSNNQLLRIVRRINRKDIDFQHVESLYQARDKLKKSSQCCYKDVKKIQKELNSILYHPDIVSVLIKHPSHYKNHLATNGFLITDSKGKATRYKRISCSSGQARNSIVIFCNEKIIDRVIKILNNGRDESVEMPKNKFNAYFGLSTTATKIVTKPKFVVVPDYINYSLFKANFVEETDWNLDDEIIIKDINLEMNRTDGMGLISPKMASQWSNDIGLDYTCNSFIIRQSFIKGLVVTFDFHEFCKLKNGNNFLIETIYKNKDGTPVMEDIRDCDLILSESQFKLASSYKSLESYVKNCEKNGLKWGVSQHEPKQYPDVANLNYQFIQALNLNKKGIESICTQFIDWIDSVSFEDGYKSLLFLLGVNHTQESLKTYLQTSNEFWIKSLILNPKLIQDKFFKQKIFYYLKNKIMRGCLGEVFVNGNFQFIITDPYAFMQHICGHEVSGLLAKDEFYSNYWNRKDCKQIIAMRSPLTYRSECTKLNLIQNQDCEFWYQYCKNGIITNWFGNECVKWAGSDYDGDILFTSNNPVLIDSIYQNELPVVYDPPKPKKEIIKHNELWEADMFSFGNKIGQITTKSTIAQTILPDLKEKYGENSREYKLTLSRMKQCCKAQSCQIDKSKIGREVKAIPSIWVTKQKIEPGDSEEVIAEKNFYNSILLIKHPYFFIYRYPDTKRSYLKYVNNRNLQSKLNFGLSLNDLKLKEHKNEKEITFIENFYKYLPVINNDCPMNYLCKFLEDHLHKLKINIKNDNGKVLCQLYKNQNVCYTQKQYKKIISEFKKYLDFLRRGYLNNESLIGFISEDDLNNFVYFISKIEKNLNIVLNCLIDYCYYEKNGNKDFLWKNFGYLIYENVKENTNDYVYDFPFLIDNKNIEPDLQYLGKPFIFKNIYGIGD